MVHEDNQSQLNHQEKFQRICKKKKFFKDPENRIFEKESKPFRTTELLILARIFREVVWDHSIYLDTFLSYLNSRFRAISNIPIINIIISTLRIQHFFPVLNSF